MNMKTPRSRIVISALVAAMLLLLPGRSDAAEESETIKVGILHSLYGPIAVVATSLKDEILMLIEEQNEKGGLLGRKLEPVVMDPESDPQLAAQLARELIEKEKVDVVFGCVTSRCRQAVRPVFEELNGLLFYPIQYEGQESSRNIIYTGPTPNQQALPGIDYMNKERGIERWYLLGSDYVYPRVTFDIVKGYLQESGISSDDIEIRFEPVGEEDWTAVVEDIRKFAAGGGKPAVISAVAGDGNLYFMRDFVKAGLTSDEVPVLALGLGEEVSGIDPAPLVGHLAVLNYFMSIDHPDNREFIERWQDFARNPFRVTKDGMEAHYIGFSLWVKAVETTGTTDVDTILDNIIGLSVPNLSGGTATVLRNHHITKPAFVGEIQPDGQFKIVWRSQGMIEADVYSKYSSEAKDLMADWRAPVRCGRYNTVTETCEDGSGKAPASE